MVPFPVIISAVFIFLKIKKQALYFKCLFLIFNIFYYLVVGAGPFTSKSSTSKINVEFGSIVLDPLGP